jgi:hypothetical protein
MRNVFDQYGQWENRITHALMSALAEDRRLLRAFLREIAHWEPEGGRKLEVEEQRLVGEIEDDAPAKEGKGGLPDGWIHDGESWSLLIESKVGAKLGIDQLDRHLREARLRGFDEVRLLAIVVNEARFELPAEVSVVEWRQIYHWLQGSAEQSRWAVLAAEYMEVAETQMIQDGLKLDGALTEFMGIPFGPDRPYSYGEAKRVLRLLTEELRKDPRISKELSINPKRDGRPAITGKAGDLVWDFLWFKQAGPAEKFTTYPHVNVVIRRDGVAARLVIPNSLKSTIRKRLTNLDQAEYAHLLGEVERNTRSILKRFPDAVPTAVGLHRHFLGQKVSVIDARLDFDLRTIAATRRKNSNLPIKICDAWVEATWEALRKSGINFELGIGVHLPYSKKMPLAAKSAAIDFFAESWLACRPLLHVLFPESAPK